MRKYIAFMALSFKKPAPLLVVFGSFVQTFIETSMPIIQWLVAFAGLVYAILKAYREWQEIRKSRKEISIHQEPDQ